jgi:hypothetical protein
MIIREYYESVKILAAEASKTAMESKTVAVSVAGFTTWLGLSGAQSLASFIATCVGIIFTSVLIVKNGLEAWIQLKKWWKDNDNHGN